MTSILVTILGGIFRYFLVLIATLLITKGLANQQDVDAFLNHPSFSAGVSGAALFCITCAWMAFNKLRTRFKLETALALPAGTTPEELTQVVSGPAAKSVKHRMKKGLPIVLLVVVLTSALLSGCGSTIELRADHEGKDGERYGGAFALTLPTREGWAK